jgi:hypothetical protein
MFGFSNINEIRATMFLCGYIGYLMTGDLKKLEMSHSFLKNQLTKEFVGKTLKIKHGHTNEIAIILFERIEKLTMAFGVVQIELIGTRTDQQPPLPGVSFFTTIEDIEYLTK